MSVTERWPLFRVSVIEVALLQSVLYREVALIKSVLYREVALIQSVLYREVALIKSVLYREVALIQSVLYREVPLYCFLYAPSVHAAWDNHPDLCQHGQHATDGGRHFTCHRKQVRTHVHMYVCMYVHALTYTH